MASPAHSPATALPPELLSAIFEVAQYWNGSDWDHEDPHTDMAVKMSHVCHSWRAAAIGNPTLWTAIVVTHVDYLAACLQRSKDLPFEVEWDTRARPSSVASIHECYEVLAPHASRMVELVLNIGKQDHVEPMLALFSLDLRQLASVSIEGFDQSPGVIVARGDLLSNIPRLEFLHLHSVRIPMRDTPLPYLNHLSMYDDNLLDLNTPC